MQVLPGWAQSYLFRVDRLNVDVYWNADGTATLDYTLVFTNLPGAAVIDYVDVGLPNSNFDVDHIFATINGQPVDWISRDDYEGSGTGVAIALGTDAIRPGQTGTVRVRIDNVRRVLHPDDTDSAYASAVFSPAWFNSQFVSGNTDISVTFHLPPGVTPQEPRWHASPAGWASQPATGIDEQGRATYTWRNGTARADTQYLFGASFPARYVPAETIVQPGLFERLGIDPGFVIFLAIFFTAFGGTAAVIALAVVSANRRQMKYLPPKISIEGHGIKRGLTAVEAALLLEEPLDKVLTLILFGVIKKGAVQITQRDPLKIETLEPVPPDLRPYETEFIEAFQMEKTNERRDRLQAMIIDLIKAVETKMKGFSRGETTAYYRDIIKRAWIQIENAGTPQLKSERFDQALEWTMLDKDYDRRTREVFSSGPVYTPAWWSRYDPGARGGVSTISQPASTGGGSGGQVSLPHLPGSDFAASFVSGTQNLAAGVVGNLSNFTSGVTNKTNPVPASTGSGGGSGGGCACACAGCACACAGGGR